MKMRIQYMTILLLFVWCTPALAQIDCQNLEKSVLPEPSEVYQACAGILGSGEAPQQLDPTDTWFAMDFGFASPDGMYSNMINTASPHNFIGGGDNLMFACDFTEPSTFTELFCIDNTLEQLFNVNTATGVPTLVASVLPSPGATWTGMAADPTSSNVYVSTATQLYTINLATGAVTTIGPTGAGIVIDIAFDLTGQLYGHDITSDQIITINKATATSAVVGPTGIAANFAQGMDLDASDGTIYLFAYLGGGAAELRSVSTATGATTLVAVIGDGANGHEMSGAIATNVLPVELSSFEAKVDGKDLVLDWSTASETNNAGFEVQHKGREAFQTLDFVEGHRSTLEAQSYSYRIADLEPGTHSFRLKQIDFDGQFEYSQEVEATLEVVGQYFLTEAYPNPFNPTATIRFAVDETQPVVMTMYNMHGQAVRTIYQGIPAADEMQVVEIDGSGLPSGLYLIQLVGNTFRADQSVTLLK